jgi:hypothetical protein
VLCAQQLKYSAMRPGEQSATGTVTAMQKKSEYKSELNFHCPDGSRRTAEVVEAAHFSPLKMASRPET